MEIFDMELASVETVKLEYILLTLIRTLTAVFCTL